jgi:hypothetical protein
MPNQMSNFFKLFIPSFLIFTFSFLICQPSLAATQEDIKKFPPVSGEIFGQAAAGVRSVLVNGKTVPFDANQNFRTDVKLRAGEKYLTLTINYENLRIIKKYLILRRSAITKFKVQVTKEKIEKSIQAAKETQQAGAQQRAQQQAQQRKVRARLARLKAKARQEYERALAVEAAREKKLKKEKAEKAWIAEIASPKYFANEFRNSSEVASLISEINAAGYNIPFRRRENSLAKLNEILVLPNFYDLVRQKNPNLTLNSFLNSLVAETGSYRYRPFNQLSSYQKKKLMLLNRLLLEALFADAPHRSTWLAAKPIPTLTKTKQYLYVWEFSEGKLLAVKQKQGNYSADIYIPVSKKWLSLKGLSEKDLQELIAKPIKSFEPAKSKQEKKK